MARVTLEIEECGGDLLPPVCCRCGDASTGVTRQTFTHTPRWAYLGIFCCLLPYFILSVILTKRRVVTLPTCDRHVYLGFWRKSCSILGTIVLVFCIIWWGISQSRAMSQVPPSFWDRIDQGAQIAGAIGGGFLLIAASFVGVRPTRITTYEITLAGVAPAFAEATEQYRVLLEEFGE